MKFIKNINKYNALYNKYDYHLIDSIEIFKFSNGIRISFWNNGKKCKEWHKNGKFIKQNYDKHIICYSDKFFDRNGNEIH
jgi:hypothetical protein